MEIKPCLRVVRGPDWEWGDQDGGEGHVGTVVEVGEPSVGDGGRAVVVQWDCGERCRYRCGVNGKYDLRVLDNAPTGNYYQPSTDCDGCASVGINGLVWRCCRCQDCVFCSTCYFSDKHLVEHDFLRRDDTHSWCRVRPREGSRKIACMGLYPGAKVHYYDLSGACKGEGLIVAIKDYSESRVRNIAVVKWEGTMSQSDCKIGLDGKVELKCISPTSNGFFYPDHLPVLGMTKIIDEAAKDVVMSGDYISVELDGEVFKMMQTDEHGGWSDGMTLLQGKVGRVKSIKDSGDLLVVYNRHNSALLLNPEAVVKVNVQDYTSSDVVRIIDDKKKAQKLQEDFGILWLEEMNDTTNQLGIVDGKDENGNVKVTVEQQSYLYSPFCLELVGDGNHWGVDPQNIEDNSKLLARVNLLLEQSNPDVLAYAAQLEDDTYIREYLTGCPNEVNRIVEGMAPIHHAVKYGKVSVVKALIEFHADVDITDEYSRTPLHYCVEYCPHRATLELCQVLLGAGANPNKINVVGETPLLKAVSCRCCRSLLGLTGSKDTDVHIEDLEGESPLHLAVREGVELAVNILISAGADPTRVNLKLETPLHLAADIGFAGALKVMVEHHPECANAKDENGLTPLHNAVLNNHFNAVSMLLKQSCCDIDAKTNLNRTPLHAAVLQGHTYLIELLVGYGVNLDVKDAEGCTPLHVLLLLDFSGISIQFQPLSGRTPELQKVKGLVQRDDSNTRLVIACFLIQEGADMKQISMLGLSDTQTLAMIGATNATVSTVVKEFCGKYARFNFRSGRYHGSLRKGTESVAENLHRLPSLTSSEGLKFCELCEEEPINVRFLPCNHEVICDICAKRATKCIKCKKPISGKEKIE